MKRRIFACMLACVFLTGGCGQPAGTPEESPAEKSAQFLTQSGEENPAGLPTQTPAQSVMESPAIRPARGSPAPPDGAGTG